MSRERVLTDIYSRLLRAFGPQHWWPGETPFEVMIGAILTQNTAWTNVVSAVSRLKSEGLLDPKKLFRVPRGRLAPLIRSSGYFNQKAKKILAFMKFFEEAFGLDIRRMKKEDTGPLREKLLGVMGIGPETADSILLYALGRPVFVVDAYTHRVLFRHGLVPEETTYEEMQSLFMDNLPHDAALFNEYHALFVRVGKTFCLKTPLCRLGKGPPTGGPCPLEELLP